MKRAWVWAAVAWLVAALCAGGAEAQPQKGVPVKDKSLKTIYRRHTLQGAAPAIGRVALQYTSEGAAGCDSERTFRDWVWSDLRVDPFTLTGPPTHTLTLVLLRQGAAFAGIFELRDASGNEVAAQLVLERTCARAADTLLLLVESVFVPPAEDSCENACTQALREKDAEQQDELTELRERLERERADRRREVEQEREERRAAIEKVKRDVERVRVEAMELTYALSVGALMTANLTSYVGPGVWLGGELRAGPLSFGVEFRTVLPATVLVPGPVPGYAQPDLSQYVGLVVPCGRYLYFFGCAVGGGGTQLAYSSRALTNSSALVPLLQLGGRLGAEVPFAANRFAVRVWGEVLYTTPSFDDTVSIGKDEYVWHRPDVSAFFGLGFVMKFGNEQAR